MAGCSSPQSRYKVLSFFFDGVEDPDAPKPAASDTGPVRGETLSAGIGPAAPQGPTAFVHKPYAEALSDKKLCGRCHGKGFGEGGSASMSMGFSPGAAWDRCGDCHGASPTAEGSGPAILRAGAPLHGPVSVGNCSVCHEPHESANPHLLRTPKSADLCLACHEDLPPRTGGMASLDCSACHDPHAAAAPGGPFLRPGAGGDCSACHVLRRDGRPWVHGPVALGQCSLCHDAHGRPGTERNVRRPVARVCTECHGELATCAAAGGKEARDCDACHDPHSAPAAAALLLRVRMGEGESSAGAFEPAGDGKRAAGSPAPDGASPR